MAAAPCSADCAWHISSQDPKLGPEQTPNTRLTNDNVDQLRVLLAAPAGLSYCDVSILLANVSCKEVSPAMLTFLAFVPSENSTDNTLQIFLHLVDWRKRASIEDKPTPTPEPGTPVLKEKDLYKGEGESGRRADPRIAIVEISRAHMVQTRSIS